MVPYPGHTFLFFKLCMKYLTLDIFSGEDLYRILFDFQLTDPLNDNFEAYGIKDKNLLNRSGSYFIFLVILIGLMILRFMINKVAVYKYESSVFRTIGIQVYEPKMDVVLKLQTMKLFMESYIDICFFVVL